ncbi:SEL1-like repeat protein [Dyella sp. C9]|uniref:SEL1-like repeat protein n=1 Tax=Dyella sp. C9 TaxID=2202154 RepID=UPI000DF003B7|nr:SEL1-like repeat protein [Dyella sp. C9]
MTRKASTCLLLAMTMGASAGTAHAAYPPQASSTPPATGAPVFTVDRTLDEVGQSYCSWGIERFLPGSYYYCVGRRELAKGNLAKSRVALQDAAAWGSKQAQFLLGIGYFKGDIAPRDRPLGLAWLALSAERKDVVYVGLLKSAMDQASAEEKARADALYQQMLPKYGDDFAAVRAERRYRREREKIMWGEAYDVQLCIDGLNSVRPPTMVKEDPDGTICQSREPVWFVARRVDERAADLFQGWTGHVTVGELGKVPVGKP